MTSRRREIYFWVQLISSFIIASFLLVAMIGHQEPDEDPESSKYVAAHDGTVCVHDMMHLAWRLKIMDEKLDHLFKVYQAINAKLNAEKKF